LVRRSAGVPLFFFLILSLVFAICGFVQAGNLSEISVQDAGKGVLRIKTYDWKGTLLQEGKGYFSNPEGVITTVVPVVEGGYFIEAIRQDGSEHIIEQINPLSQSSGLVFTYLEESPADFTYIDKVASFPAREDEVWISGPGKSGNIELHKAVVIEARKVPGLNKYLFVRTSIPLGGAGSPLINEKGEVAGMVLFLAADMDNAGIIVSTDMIRSSYGVSGEIVSFLTWTEGRITPWLEEETGFYLRGVASYSVGNYQHAVDYLERIVDTPRYGIRKANLILGDCYRDMGETQKAIEAYEKALGKARRLSDSHLSLARLYLKQNRVVDARRIWEETARYDQKGNNSVIMMAWLLDATGDTDEALVLAKKAAEMDPASARAQGTLGEILSKQGRYDKAFLALEQSVLLRPDRKEFVADLCYAAIHSGRHERAIKVCDQAARSDNEKALYLMYLGDAYAAGGMNTKALESYRLSVKKDPHNLRVRCRIGDLLAETGRHQEAAAVFQDALATLPDSAWIHFKLGKMYGLMGDRKAAAMEILVLKDINMTLADQLSLLLVAEGIVPSH
jgi:tetratricopeptide (TPR) repeat protein